MKSKRLMAIISFLDKKDSFIDIGCDHAYVSIDMAKKGTKNILATDIHQEALEHAKKNIYKEDLGHVIKTLVTDGLENIEVSDYDTLVISGMGTSTIMHILKDLKKLQTIKKIILQSNNDLRVLRKFMMDIGYCLEDEKIILEQNHYYSILKYKKKKQLLTNVELEFGLYKKEHQFYYEFLQDKYQTLLKKIPKEKKEYDLYQEKISLLKNYL